MKTSKTCTKCKTTKPCKSCNTGLGGLQADEGIKFILKALDYIKKYEDV